MVSLGKQPKKKILLMNSYNHQTLIRKICPHIDSSTNMTRTMSWAPQILFFLHFICQIPGSLICIIAPGQRTFRTPFINEVTDTHCLGPFDSNKNCQCICFIYQSHSIRLKNLHEVVAAETQIKPGTPTVHMLLIALAKLSLK